MMDIKNISNFYYPKWGNISVLEIDGYAHYSKFGGSLSILWCHIRHTVAILGTIKGKTYGLSRLSVLLP